MKQSTILAVLCASFAATTATAEPFTYQGTLQDGGTPADGEYDFSFRLYDAQVGGNQVGSTLFFNDVLVTNGVFEVEANFGDVFNADDSFIFIEVRDGTSVGAYTALLPRSPVTATPKAQHATTADTVLNPQWTEAPGILHYGDGNDRVFINRSSFIDPSEYFGVHSTLPGFAGMFVSGPDGSLPYYGYSVDGTVNAYTYYDDISGNWILWRDGNALSVDGSQNLTVLNDANADNFNFNTPKTNYISVAGDAFVSGSNDPFFSSSGNGGTYPSTAGSGWLVAGVNLPHGATVTEVRFYVTDTSAAADISLDLERLRHGFGGFSSIASVSTSGFNGTYLERIDTTISNPVVDNNLYHYHLRIFSTNWSGSLSMNIHSVVIEYTTTQAD